MKLPALQERKVWIGLVAAAMLSGTGIAGYIAQQQNPGAMGTSDGVPTAQRLEKQLSVYWIASQGTKFVAVPVAIAAPSQGEAIQRALEKLMTDSPQTGDRYNAIPAGTKILGITAKDKEIRLNLSREFTTGGGSASMTGRVVQVLYTATSLDPEARLYLSVEGKAIGSLGGEGVEIPQPMTRRDFPAEF